MFGWRRTMEIGIASLVLVLIVSCCISCVMSKACSSSFVPSSSPSVTNNELGVGVGGSVDVGGGGDKNSISSSLDGDEKTDVNGVIQDMPTKDGNIQTTTTTDDIIEDEGNNITTSKPSKLPISVTIYSANNHYGRSAVLTFTNKDCQNLPEIMRNRVNSINTHGECAILCDKLHCKGWCIEFKVGSPSHHRFRKLRFQNRAESAIACD